MNLYCGIPLKSIPSASPFCSLRGFSYRLSYFLLDGYYVINFSLQPTSGINSKLLIISSFPCFKSVIIHFKQCHLCYDTIVITSDTLICVAFGLQESSLWFGLCYIIASLSIYDEYSNDILDMPEGSCFPRFYPALQ